MDDRRLEAYLNLMRSLLNCPSGEENQILEANSELVDAGLVEVMLEEANNLRIDNNLDDANSLMTLAGHLMGTYGNTMPDKSSPSTYLTFLKEVLQVTADSKGDRNVIYPLLRDNLNLVNDNFAVALQNWVRETLPKLDEKKQIYMIRVIGSFSNAIQQFSLGSRASNLEIAIAGYEVALTVFNRQEYTKEWAATQNNWATAYRYRIKGKKAENLEMAISAYQASLEVYNCEEFRFEWATAQNNLGSAYLDRITGEKPHNIEMAIAAYREALKVHTREAFPKDWAATQNNLGMAYSNRIRGKKRNNLERAIAAYRKALKVHTREEFPFEWALIQNNLGAVYTNRIRGEKADNLEMAISACQAALSVRTREKFPINHAETLYNLGLAYRYNSQLPEAYNSFQAAIETVESMRSEIIIGGEADRQKLAEEWNKLYQPMVKVCLEMENKTAALEYIERSKTRNLVELFHNARSLSQNLQRISFQEIHSLLGEDEAILEWYLTFNGFKVFIITHDSTQPDVWQSSDADLEALRDFANEYINDYIYQKDNWEKQLEIRLEKLAKILYIDEIISRLPESCQRLILVPFLYLHLLPLHALTSRRLNQNTEETASLLELFPGGVRYTPSCQLLQ